MQAQEQKRQRKLVVSTAALNNGNDWISLGQLPEECDEWLQTNLTCQNTCPAHTDVSTYVDLIAQGRFDEAYLVNRRDNVFPGVLGRICARPCEKNCRRGLKDEPVAICWLKRSSADYRSSDLLPIKPPVTRPQRVAVVGAGPSGLSCARDLRLLGYATTVYDAMPTPGGMLVAGIPAWRLPRDVVREEVDCYMDALGVQFQLNTKVGVDEKISVKDLLNEYSAVFLAPGCQNPVKLRLPGENYQGFEYGLTWLEKINLPPQPKLDLSGKRVVIIGAGYTAIDCARSALRLGASEVYLCYRRSQKEAPLEPEEIEEAANEGIKFVFLVSPLEVLGDKENRVKGLKLIRNVLAEPDKWGRRKPEPLAGSEFVISCELILAATGQESDFSWLPEELQVQIKETGKLFTGQGQEQESWMTTLPGLFAGGDFTSGPRNVISAIADGHKAAKAIHRFLSGETETGRVGKLEKVAYPRRELGYLKVRRQLMPCLSFTERLVKRGDQQPVELEVEEGYSRQNAIAEAARCLQCFYNIFIEEENCTFCGACQEVCPEKVIHILPLAEVNGVETATEQKPHPNGAKAIVLDEARCVRCGQCVAECPTLAIKMGRYSTKSGVSK